MLIMFAAAAQGTTYVDNVWVCLRECLFIT